MSRHLSALAVQPFCYLTTTGRRTGHPHTIEIWFALNGAVLYMLSGGGERSHWVKNLMESPQVKVRIGDQQFRGRARLVRDPAEDTLARRLLLQKYSPGYSGDLSEWGRTATPVAVDTVLE